MAKFLRIYVQITLLGAAGLAFLSTPIFFLAGGMYFGGVGTREGQMIGVAVMLSPLVLGAVLLAGMVWVIKRPQWHRAVAIAMSCLIVAVLAYFGPGKVLRVLLSVVLF